MVVEAGLGVALGGDLEVGEVAALVLGVEVLEEGDAPLAAGAGGEALGDEGGDGGVLAVEEGADFAEGDVEAEADVVVGVHGGIVGDACRARYTPPMEPKDKDPYEVVVDTWLRRVARRPAWRLGSAVAVGAGYLVIATSMTVSMNHGSALLAAISALPMAAMFTGINLVYAIYFRCGEETRCAKCDYDLAGLKDEAGSADRCPECGAHWRERGGVVKGRRVFRPWVALSAAALVLFTISDLAFTMSHLGIANGWKMRLLPTRVLIQEVATAKGFLHEQWAELRRRSLTPTQAAALDDRLLDRRLREQHLDLEAEQWLEARALARELSPGSAERYFRETVDLRLAAPERAETGQSITVSLRGVNRGSFWAPANTKLTAEVYFGGFESPVRSTGPSDKQVTPAAIELGTDTPTLSLRPTQAGELPVRCCAWVVIGPRTALGGPPVWKADGTPTIPVAAVWSGRFDLHRSIFVDPASSPVPAESR